MMIKYIYLLYIFPFHNILVEIQKARHQTFVLRQSLLTEGDETRAVSINFLEELGHV